MFNLNIFIINIYNLEVIEGYSWDFFGFCLAKCFFRGGEARDGRIEMIGLIGGSFSGVFEDLIGR